MESVVLSVILLKYCSAGCCFTNNFPAVTGIISNVAATSMIVSFDWHGTWLTQHFGRHNTWLTQHLADTTFWPTQYLADTTFWPTQHLIDTSFGRHYYYLVTSL
jgi:hypothetical protein